MRRLTGFKIIRGRADQYVFEWQNKNEAGAQELYTYRGTEPPRPELLTSAREVAAVAAKMISLLVSGSEAREGASFYAMTVEYPSSGDFYRLKIKASMEIHHGYTFGYTTPNWKVWYRNMDELNNTIREAVQKLWQECWKYIDGERAQTKLEFADKQTKEVEA